MKPIRERHDATDDVRSIVARFRQVSPDLSDAFVDELEKAYDQIATFPAGGSPLWGQRLDLPGLRSWTIKRFGYLVFYVEQADHVEVWRLLHAASDIPAWLADPEEV
jgi:toxin ParE1/3/4